MLSDRAKEIVAAAEKKMQAAVSFLEEDLKTYRVGKANPSIFNGVTVNFILENIFLKKRPKKCIK